jgi:hypothetical protein
VLLVPVFLNYPTYTTVADTAACYMQATGIKNYVALNQGSEPKAYAATYFDIKKALEGKWGTGIMAVVQKVRVYFRLHPTGSEVASSGKTFNMSVIQY